MKRLSPEVWMFMSPRHTATADRSVASGTCDRGFESHSRDGCLSFPFQSDG